MIVCVCGSRSIKNFGTVQAAIVMFQEHYCLSVITEVVTGGAEGVDTLADQWAKENGVDRTIMPANWKKHGRGGGYHRNERMVRYSDVVLAIWDGRSKGTQHTIKIAENHKKQVYVYDITQFTTQVQEASEFAN